MLRIDFNADIGECYPDDEALMPFISSVNIACGYHAGDTQTMRESVRLAIKYQVAMGAHPGFPDKPHAGRRNMHLPQEQITEIVSRQLQTLSAIAGSAGARLAHVKPHGALYNMSAKDSELAKAICRAVDSFDPNLRLYALSGSEMIRVGKAMGLHMCSEVFADRTYTDDGSLTPRTMKGALIKDVDAACRQVLQIIEKGTVVSITGKEIAVNAETICIHGDGLHAVRFATAIRKLLEQHHVRVSSMAAA